MSMFSTTKDFLKETFTEFTEDDCPLLAAGIAYYTIFAMPPLLVLIILISGVFVSPEQVQGDIATQMRDLIGADGAQQIRTMIEQANQPGTGGWLETIGGIAAIVFGATGAFVQLQTALNKAWEVEPDPDQGGWKNFLLKRVLSLGMILGVAFLLLVSLALSAAVSAFGDYLGGLMGGVSSYMLAVMNFGLSFIIITLLFAAMFKVLPDAIIGWRDVWIGGATTALLFVLGKYLIGLYLGNSDVGSAYGAAGSLAIVLIWIYYSSMILLLGAEFTQVWAARHGVGIRPEKGAVRIVREKRKALPDGKERQMELGL